ncbi:hypothetical protein EWM64_g7028 [Hericium alpestre]|uniref:FAD-binding domain-containing protein n=1 Tax=Hericium alpestre TaxID=135208 RepID=A0A4Y9ZRT3_9AGAM|nr:hypothetical protein EWM64_g7028 [Hericium alpestre]
MSIKGDSGGLSRLITDGEIFVGAEGRRDQITVRYPLSDPDDSLKAATILYHLISSSVGRPLWDYQSDAELLQGMLDAMDACELLWKNQILHRGVSAGNIILAVNPGPIGAVGFLSDVEFARMPADVRFSGDSEYASSATNCDDRLRPQQTAGYVIYVYDASGQHAGSTHISDAKLETVVQNMSSPKFRVAICGGGIGGLTLAVALGKYSDIPIDVYEAANEIGTVGAGLAVWKRTWDVMQSLGLEAEMTKRKIPLPQEKDEPSVMIRRADDPKGGADLYQLVSSYGSIPLHRMHLVDMLRDLLPKTCTVHTSKRLSKYTHKADGSLTLHFADGETATTDVLVGADGIHSLVRAQLSQELLAAGRLYPGLNAPDAYSKSVNPRWTGSMVYRSLIAPSKVRTDHPIWSTTGICYSGKGKHIIAYPISNGSMINFLAFYTVPDGEGMPFPGKWVEDAPKEEALAHYVGWEPDVQEILQMHAMTPHVSAGAGQAMEDACMLGRLHAHDLTTHDTVPAAIQIYEDRRLAFANAVVAAARETGLMYEFNGPEYDGALPMDADALRRWREGIFRRWEFQWQGSPLEECREAEETLRRAVLVN